jgi:hypothetical protein
MLECGICQDPIEDEVDCKQCSFISCKKCIEHWYTVKPSCPQCRFHDPDIEYPDQEFRDNPLPIAESDIGFVMSQAGVSRERAMDSLLYSDQDVVDAILYATGRNYSRIEFRIGTEIIIQSYTADPDADLIQ